MKRCAPLVVVAIAAAAPAQVLYTGATYRQTFDTLPAAGSGHTFVNNAPAPGMEGWYARTSALGADDGSIDASEQYSYGLVGRSDRAIGSVATYGALFAVGVRIRNTTQLTYTGMDLRYTGEQWRGGGTNRPDILAFAYSTNATELGTGFWTSVRAMEFLAPKQDGPPTSLDGNLPEYRQTLSTSLSGLAWAPGQELWLRWAHLGNGSGHGLAVDDLEFTATPVPEPASVGLLVALAALAAHRQKTQRHSEKPHPNE